MKLSIEYMASLCRVAGEDILRVYETEFAVEAKADESPLTLADRLSHRRIADGLTREYPGIPLLSEEGEHPPYAERRKWKRFWLVDPLDGTKEFVKRNGEFTVNIALIEDGYPVFGMIYIPVADVLYYGDERGAFKVAAGGAAERIRVRSRGADEPVVLAESRSHPSPELTAYVDTLAPRQLARIERGSSLKFCVVAEGAADVYPRFGPTMEWDTAAGQAIVEAAGGVVLTPGGERLACNSETLRNGAFLAAASREWVRG